MTGPSALETRRMTPDDVLRVLADSHRQQCQYDPGADPDAVISYDMTVAEWRSACNLFQWRPLGRALDAEFGTSFPDEEWKRVLTPPKRRTLRDVCDLIAWQAVVPVVKPMKVSGKPCLSAGAFFAVRNLLRRAGADTSSIRPSTPLAQYLRDWAGAVLSELTKIAPGSLPPVKIGKPFYERSFLLVLVGMLSTAFFSWLQWPLFVLVALGLWLAGHLGLFVGARIRPRRASFGALGTFGDLARAIAGHQGRLTQ